MGHSARLVELFAEAGVSFAVLRPQSLAEASEAGYPSSSFGLFPNTPSILSNTSGVSLAATSSAFMFS